MAPPYEPTTPPANIPPAGSKEIKMSKSDMEALIKKLRTDYDELRKRRPKESIDDAHPTEAAMGDYTAGRSLFQTVVTARNTIGSTWESFLSSYLGVITALEKSVANHANTELANKKNIGNVGGGTYV